MIDNPRWIVVRNEDLDPVMVADHPGGPLPMYAREFVPAEDQEIWDMTDPDAMVEMTARLEGFKAAALNKHRRERVAAGASFTLTDYAQEVHLPGSPEEQTVLLGLGMQAQIRVAAGITTTMLYRDLNDVVHGLTPVQMVELVAKGAAWVEYMHTVAWAMKDSPDPIPDDFTADHHWQE